jgi:hypothetical protein
MNPVTKRVITITVGVMMLGTVAASAAPRRAVVVAPHIVVHRPFLYDPFGGPWYPYPNAYGYSYDIRPQASIRTEVTPKDAAVYVDGYYAGTADNFNGAFKHLQVTPGGHTITLYLEGFRTVTRDVYVRPDSTFKLSTDMARLAPGETSAAVPVPSDD